MKKLLPGILIILLMSSSIINAEQTNSKSEFAKPKFDIGLTLGTNGGFGGELYTMVSNLSPSSPLKLRFVIGYSSLDPGIPDEARKIFINDATNGTPSENGHLYDLKFDIVLPINILSLEKSYIYAGPRYTKFTANFLYVGGNEDFYIRSKQWGFGTGVETYFPVNPKFNLVLTTGIDYMKQGILEGHDTSYSPNGSTGNERDTYTYEDADHAINQPKLELNLMIGFTYGL